MTATDALGETLDAASVALGTRLRVAGDAFPGSRRTLVVRAADDDGRSVVVKRYLTDEGREAYAREASALAALGGRWGSGAIERTPTLLAECSEPRLVVMADVGRASHLADALLGADAGVAGGRLVGWGEAVAALHVAGAEVHDDFASGVASRSTETVVLDYLPQQLAESAAEWERLADALGVATPPGTFDVLSSVTSRFRVDASSLSAADMCPDNNLVTDAGLVLLDFEFALWRPVVWDAAYLRVPWPTCWCAWSLDAAAAELALDAWRRSVAVAWPAVLTDGFDDDLDLATEAWAWLAGSWCLAGLVDGEERRHNPLKPMPEMPDRVLRFLRTASRGRALPELAAVAARLADVVTTRYAAHPVPLAPAFATGGLR